MRTYQFDDPKVKQYYLSKTWIVIFSDNSDRIGLPKFCDTSIGIRTFNPFQPSVAFHIETSYFFLALQVKWLVAVWNATLGWSPGDHQIDQDHSRGKFNVTVRRSQKYKWTLLVVFENMCTLSCFIAVTILRYLNKL